VLRPDVETTRRDGWRRRDQGQQRREIERNQTRSEIAVKRDLVRSIEILSRSGEIWRDQARTEATVGRDQVRSDDVICRIIHILSGQMV